MTSRSDDPKGVAAMDGRHKKGRPKSPFSGEPGISPDSPFAHGSDHQWWSDQQFQLPAYAFL
jgi:hypothetical protein